MLRILARFRPAEVATFLAVGGCGYVVDVALFNALLAATTLGPTVDRLVAAVAATGVNYVGNRLLTWRGASRHDRNREMVLFAVFSLLGVGISLLCLVVSHDVLGLTGRLADNVSANVVGLGLGTVFRFWSYRRFVFGAAPAGAQPACAPPEPARCLGR